MSSSTAAQSLPRPPHVLADLLPARGRPLIRDTTLVLGGAGFIAVFAQLIVPLPFTPVPISLGTFAALLTGAALGSARGGLAVLLYIVAGTLGAPVFSHAGSGWTLPTFGYILAYLPAAVLLGVLASRGVDRRPVRLSGGVALASGVLYLGGVPWLMASTGFGFGEALVKGVLPFLVGDAVKAAVISVALPSVWRFVGHTRRG